MAQQNSQPFSRLVVTDPATNRVVQDLYDKLNMIGSVVNKPTATPTREQMTTVAPSTTSSKSSTALVWTPLSLQNSWVTFYSSLAPSYTIDSLGFVHLKGSVKSGTFANGTPIANLPVGFRSTALISSPLNYTVQCAVGTVGVIYTDSSGDLKTFGFTANSFVNLDGILIPTS